MRTVEFLVAWTSQTWSTVTVEVPLDTEEHGPLLEWANEHLPEHPEVKGGDVALFAVYWIAPETEDDE